MIENHNTGTSLEEKKRLAYEYLLQVRNLDSQLMWTRSNIMLLVQGGLLAILTSQFQVLTKDHPLLILLMSLFFSGCEALQVPVGPKVAATPFLPPDYELPESQYARVGIHR